MFCKTFPDTTKTIAGSKALSNVTQQFSKLKLANTFKPKRSKNPKFGIGLKFGQDSSSSSEDEYENSIFQPQIPVQAALEYATDSSSSGDKSVEIAVELTENAMITDEFTEKKKISDDFSDKDAYLPGVGIVMGSQGDINSVVTHEGTLQPKENLLTSQDSSQVDSVQLSSIMRNVSLQNPNFSADDSKSAPNPEIRVSADDSGQPQPPRPPKLDNKLSHSSGEVDAADCACAPDATRLEKRSSSQCELSLSISQSQSESALKSKIANLASPVSSVTKDLVFSPLSKLAKGMQNLGANLDPRKLSVAGIRGVTERELEEHRKLQERWKDCKTRLIAL